MKWPGSHRLPVVKMIRVQTENFDPGAELEQLRSRNNGQAGAMVSFTGLVRDLNAGDICNKQNVLFTKDAFLALLDKKKN